MTLWVVYLISSFGIGVLLWRKPWNTRVKIAAGLCVLISMGYYLLRQI